MHKRHTNVLEEEGNERNLLPFWAFHSILLVGVIISIITQSSRYKLSTKTFCSCLRPRKIETTSSTAENYDVRSFIAISAVGVRFKFSEEPVGLPYWLSEAPKRY